MQKMFYFQPPVNLLVNLVKVFVFVSVNSDDDEADAVEVDVCLRGFSTVTLGRLPSKVNFCSSFSL